MDLDEQDVQILLRLPQRRPLVGGFAVAWVGQIIRQLY